MKKLFVWVSIFLLAGGAAQAQEDAPLSGVTWSAGVDTGVIVGQAEEIAYPGSSASSAWDGAYLSQLLWDMQPIAYAGVKARVNINRFFAAQSLKFGIPGETGSMEDRDWLAYFTATNKATLTNYSISDTNLAAAVFSETRIGWRHPLRGAAAGEAFAAFDVKYVQFEANYTQGLYYDEDSNGRSAGYIWESTEKNIAYEQTWLIPSVGYQAAGALNGYFSGSVFVKLSPLPIAFAKDAHYQRLLYIEESLLGGFYLNPGFTFTFTPNQKISLSLAVSYTGIWGVRGNAFYSWEAGSDEYPAGHTLLDINAVGAGWSAWDAGLNFSLRF